MRTTRKMMKPTKSGQKCGSVRPHDMRWEDIIDEIQLVASSILRKGEEPVCVGALNEGFYMLYVGLGFS